MITIRNFAVSRFHHCARFSGLLRRFSLLEVERVERDDYRYVSYQLNTLARKENNTGTRVLDIGVWGVVAQGFEFLLKKKHLQKMKLEIC